MDRNGLFDAALADMGAVSSYVPAEPRFLPWLVPVPVGEITEVFGAVGVGKTELALRLATSVQRDGGTVAYFSLDGGLYREQAARCGTNWQELLVLTSPWQIGRVVGALVEEGVTLVVVDTTAYVGAEWMRQLLAVRELADTALVLITETQTKLVGLGEVQVSGEDVRRVAALRLQVTPDSVTVAKNSLRPPGGVARNWSS